MTTRSCSLFSCRLNRGFTLLELLVTVLILAVLIGLIVPAVPKVILKGKVAKDLHNLRQIGVALQGYAAENQGEFPLPPSNANPWLLGGKSGSDYKLKAEKRPLYEYVDGNTALFHSPLDVGESRQLGATRSESYFDRLGTSYVYNTRIADVPPGSQTLMRRPAKGSPGYGQNFPVRMASIPTPSRTLALALPDIGVTEGRAPLRWLLGPGEELQATALFVDGHVQILKVLPAEDPERAYQFYTDNQ